MARLPQHGQPILRCPDQPRLERAHQREVKEPLGLGADRLRLRARGLELRNQRAALVQEGEEPLDEGNGARGGLVVHGAATVAEPAAPGNARPMPRAPRRRPPAPDDRQVALPLPAGRRKPPTPEQIAKVVTAKLKSPAGMPDKAELALRVVLPRAVIERLMVRAHREEYPSLAAWVQAVLEREGKDRGG